MGSLLYAVIITRPDIAFAVSRLARFNQNLSVKYHEAADRVIRYLYRTIGLAIVYGGSTTRRCDKGARAFICASDASFADNSVDRKSSQGYAMTLFGGAI